MCPHMNAQQSNMNRSALLPIMNRLRWQFFQCDSSRSASTIQCVVKHLIATTSIHMMIRSSLNYLSGQSDHTTVNEAITRREEKVTMIVCLLVIKSRPFLWSSFESAARHIYTLLKQHFVNLTITSRAPFISYILFNIFHSLRYHLKQFFSLLTSKIISQPKKHNAVLFMR
jgi:hypothetical protein